MAQFDYYKNPDGRSRAWAPYIVDLQHDMMNALSTRMMAPVLSREAVGTAVMQGVTPAVEIGGTIYFVSIPEMAAVPVAALGEHQGSITANRRELLGAVDLLFTAV